MDPVRPQSICNIYQYVEASTRIQSMCVVSKPGEV